MQSDQDGDGKISKDEAPEFMQQFFDRVDANADGFLDETEIQSMRIIDSPYGGHRLLKLVNRNMSTNNAASTPYAIPMKATANNKRAMSIKPSSLS